jgi:F-type H+-transporting ATPase subunit b
MPACRAWFAAGLVVGALGAPALARAQTAPSAAPNAAQTPSPNAAPGAAQTPSPNAAPGAAQTPSGAEAIPSAEAERASRAGAGDSEKATGPGSEHHEGAGEEAEDPSKHFNFLGLESGHLFDYMGKDEYGGKFGDGKMEDPETQRVVREEEPASPPFVFMILNFALLLGLLAKWGWPFARKVAEDRHDLIKSALEEAAQLRAQAAGKLAEYEARLQKADAEIGKLVADMRSDAENEKQRILAAADAQAAMMKRDAEQRIAAEIELARVQLTREVTAAAVAATEKLLRAKMTPGDQQQLVSTFIADVQHAAPLGRPAGPGDVR